jgi:hypothetical protein
VRNAYTILIGKPKGQRSLWRPIARWKDNVIEGNKGLNRPGVGSNEELSEYSNETTRSCPAV